MVPAVGLDRRSVFSTAEMNLQTCSVPCPNVHIKTREVYVMFMLMVLNYPLLKCQPILLGCCHTEVQHHKALITVKVKALETQS